MCVVFGREWLAEDKARAIAAEKARIEEEEANMLVGPELPAGVTQQDMGDYGGALLPGRPFCGFTFTLRSQLIYTSCDVV